ncbi:hypothetical protein ACS0TY_035616 [Phlomoides rotata]
MKVLSYNIRGAGRREKRREVRELIEKSRIEICCLQEIKVEEVNKRLCKSIWGNSPSDWAWLGSIGNTGGILTIWNSEVFQKTSEWSRTGMLVVNGRWVEDDSICTIINVYAPNSAAQRGELWEILQALGDHHLSGQIGHRKMSLLIFCNSEASNLIYFYFSVFLFCCAY